VIVRVMEASLLSFVLDSAVPVSSRAVAHVLLYSLNFHVEYCHTFILFCIGIVVCLSFTSKYS